MIAVNAWIDRPQGFDLDSAGGIVTNVRPLEVLFNPATGYEFFHMFLAASRHRLSLIASGVCRWGCSVVAVTATTGSAW